MKKVLFLLSVVLIAFSSCTEVDLRDDLVGSWSYSSKGNISMTMGGEVASDLPIDATGTATVTKVGEDQIKIDDLIATVDGSKLIFEPEIQTESEEGMTSTSTVTRTGTISGKTMTITETHTGTWDMAGMMSGALSGTATHTFTKK